MSDIVLSPIVGRLSHCNGESFGSSEEYYAVFLGDVFEAYLDPVVKTSSSSYVVPLLEKIGVIEVDYRRPARIRLIE
jgi:hypothetical protein